MIKRGSGSRERGRIAWPAFMLIVCSLLWAPPLAAQDDEPVLDQLREAITSEFLTLRLLVQTVVDAGIDEAPTNARINAARVRLSGSLDEGFSYMIQTDFARSPSLLDARVGWTFDNGIFLHAGRFKTPFSGELLTYVGDLDFIGRARVVSALAPSRQIGLQAGGPIADLVTLTVGGFSGGSNQPQNEALAGVGRIAVTPEVGGGTLSLAGNVAIGRDAAIAGPFGAGFEGEGLLVGLDGRFEMGRLLLAAEFIHADWDPEVGPGDATSDGVAAWAGWSVLDGHRALARWDRYRAPGSSEDDDLLVLGYNLMPISAVEFQLNWRVPLTDGGGPHAVLANFEVGF